MWLYLEEPPWFWLGGSSSFLAQVVLVQFWSCVKSSFPFEEKIILLFPLALTLCLSLTDGAVFAVDVFIFVDEVFFAFLEKTIGETAVRVEDVFGGMVAEASFSSSRTASEESN